MRLWPGSIRREWPGSGAVLEASVPKGHQNMNVFVGPCVRMEVKGGMRTVLGWK